MLPRCPDLLPAEILKAAEALSYAYAKSAVRPRLAPDVLRHWDSLIDAWSEDSLLPLFVRKQNADIGSALMHTGTGRVLAPCDNSPAHWAMMKAFEKGSAVTLSEIRELYIRIPVTMAMSKVEIQAAHFKAVLSAHGSVNDNGWKLDHIEEVGLKSRGRIEDMPMDSLKRHFRQLMKPSNMILIPTALKGLGDLPSFLSIIKSGA